MKDMAIEKIFGYEQRVYQLIAPFIMNPEVIRLNGGYPFKNSEDHVWYVCIDKENMVRGFISVFNNKLCNDFTWQDLDLLEQLIRRALQDVAKGNDITFIADTNDLPLLEKLGFSILKPGVKYFKMGKKV